jgi:hypothetical protein
MKSNITYGAVVYWIASVAATATLTTHVMQWNRYQNEMQKPAVTAQNVASRASLANTDLKLTAPYRDGVYMAKLTQQRGEQRQAAVGRWATDETRNAFAAGYDRGYQVTARLVDLAPAK